MTCGVKWRRSRLCKISWAICTSVVRGAPGSGVSETRMVSPMPCCSKMARPAVEATVPLMPMPASVNPEMQGMVGAFCQHQIDGNQILHLGNLGRQDDFIAGHAHFFGQFGIFQGRIAQSLHARPVGFQAGQGHWRFHPSSWSVILDQAIPN